MEMLSTVCLSLERVYSTSIFMKLEKQIFCNLPFGNTEALAVASRAVGRVFVEMAKVKVVVELVERFAFLYLVGWWRIR